MKSTDQAFIKAFRKRDAKGAEDAAAPTRTRRLLDALAAGGSAPQAGSRRLERSSDQEVPAPHLNFAYEATAGDGALPTDEATILVMPPGSPSAPLSSQSEPAGSSRQTADEVELPEPRGATYSASADSGSAGSDAVTEAKPPVALPTAELRIVVESAPRGEIRPTAAAAAEATVELRADEPHAEHAAAGAAPPKEWQEGPAVEPPTPWIAPPSAPTSEAPVHEPVEVVRPVPAPPVSEPVAEPTAAPESPAVAEQPIAPDASEESAPVAPPHTVFHPAPAAAQAKAVASKVPVATEADQKPVADKPAAAASNNQTSGDAEPATDTDNDTDTDTGAETEPFQAVWEVDQFAWPQTANDLYESQQAYFEQAGQQLHSATGEGLHVMAISSSERGEGRSTLALCLARAAAEAGVRVALFDADIENPGLGPALNVEAPHGWNAVLEDGLPLSEAAIASLEDGICLFPLTADVLDSPIGLEDSRVSQLLRSVADQFDLVILDGGPVGGEEGRMFEVGEGCPIDAAIVVRDLRLTDVGALNQVVSRWRKAGIDAVGVAENFVSAAEMTAG